MKKQIFSFLVASSLLGASIVTADSGVIIHKKDGSSTFYSSVEVEYIEFLENFDSQDPLDPSAPDSNWTVEYALSQIKSGFEGNATVKGYIISITEISTSYGNATYVIADKITETAGLMIYRGYYMEGKKFTSSDQLKVGDLVVVSGSLVNYNGNTPEFTTGSKIISLTPATGNNDNENKGDNNTDTSDSVPNEYTYPLSYVKLPAGTPQQVKEYTGFTVNFNKDNHTPNYVAWELTSTEANGSVNTSRSYWQDTDIIGCAPVDDGWASAGYDRGHMCPAADQKWSSAAMKDCAVMTNMVPQPNSFNGGKWATLEGKERSNAEKYGKIWIISGPLYDNNDTKLIGSAKTRVPGACFKVFLYENGANSKAIAFVMNNDNTNTGDLSNYAMSVDELEEITGFDFFPSLPDDIENTVEATFNYSSWN